MAKRKAQRKQIKNIKASKKRRIRRNANTKCINKRKIKTTYSTFNDKKELKEILLPEELLKIAKSKLDDALSISCLEEAIKIYDINDYINFNYLSKCNSIENKNIKYVYTLSYDNRKKIIKKYNLDKQYIFEYRSKQIFIDLLKFIANSNLNANTSKNPFRVFNLKGFNEFIIPISEGTEELKYYYVISVIQCWLDNPDNYNTVQNICSSLYYNLINSPSFEDIDNIFYIIFRIDFLFFYNISIDAKKIKELEMLYENKNDTIRALLIINDEIEGFNNKNITSNTVLTLKKNNFKFNPNDYNFIGYTTKPMILQNINQKNQMNYQYYSINKFNLFSCPEDKNAFIGFVNEILQSNVIQEYFKKVKSFKNYYFPFKNKKILDFLWEKVIFADLDDNSWGFSNKEGFGIFINRQKKYGSTIQLNYGGYIIAITHEFVGHYLRLLININDKKKAGTGTPIKVYNNNKDNELAKNLIDGGDKYEAILFGEKVERLFIGGNHYLFDINNWTKPIDEFREGFKNNNIIKSVKILKTELKGLKSKNNYFNILFKNVNYNKITMTQKSQSISTSSNRLVDPQSININAV